MFKSYIRTVHAPAIATRYTSDDVPDQFALARVNARYTETVAIVRAQTSVVFCETVFFVDASRPLLQLVVAQSDPVPIPGVTVAGLQSGIAYLKTGGEIPIRAEKYPTVVAIARAIRKFVVRPGIKAFEIVLNGEMRDEFMLMAILLPRDPSFDITVSDDDSIFFPRRIPVDVVYDYLYSRGELRAVRYLYPTPNIPLSGGWKGITQDQFYSPDILLIDRLAKLEVRADWYDVEYESNFVPTLNAIEDGLTFNPGSRMAKTRLVVDCDTGREWSLDGLEFVRLSCPIKYAFRSSADSALISALVGISEPAVAT